MKELPVALTADLHGRALIEASAGTGKTWTISGLYARLVAEKGLAPEQILTVTFTRAATAELRERIRLKLQDTLAALRGEEVADDFCLALARRAEDAGLAARRVVAALAAFDDAAIYTIHGFCQRALADRAFSSGMPFGTELLADARAVVDEVVRDFWRREVATPHARPAPQSARLARYILQRCGSPEQLSTWVQRWLAKPGLRIEGPPPRDPGPPLAALDELHGRLGALWRGARTEVLGLLRDSPHLNRNSYRLTSIDAWALEMDAYFDTLADPLCPPRCFEKFTATQLAKALKKNGLAPGHPFFGATDELPPRVADADDALHAADVELRLRLLAFARDELPRRLAEERLQAFDDLLRNLHDALQAEHGGRLAAALRERYPAALIDEFQDTDPLQYGIFRRIYPASAADCALFFVGDPKQAIYSFRGADLYAYLDAARDCEHVYRLDVNQRSVPALVRSVNALFQSRPQPFREAAIAYPPARAADRPRAALMEGGEEDATPLRFVLAPPMQDGKAFTKTAASDWAARATAAEIVRLLGGASRGELRLGERQLCAGDIAVLVNTARQAACMRRALRAVGVGCAEQSRESVFQTYEAEELERLLLAVADPRREGMVRAALAGVFFDLDAAALAELDADERAAARRAEQLRGYHELWRDRGLMVMLRRLTAEQGVVARLARMVDGERRLTNLLHLAELAHLAAERLHGMEAVINWLASRRRETREDEEAQLRLESDENLVQIVTVHRSKGLEYPVVFCPWLWEGRAANGGSAECLYHDPEAGFEAVLDLGSPRLEAARERARQEDLAERLRLAYVALTRACNRCYVFWGRIKDAGASPVGWLLHGLEAGEGPDQAALDEALASLVERAEGGIAIAEAAPEGQLIDGRSEENLQLSVRQPARPVPHAWRLTSFSAMLEEAAEAWRAEAPDYEQRFDARPGAEARGGGRFAFPRGAEAGTCLHAMLETMDFRAPATWAGPVGEALAQYGMPQEWRADVEVWLGAALATPLEGGGYVLGALPRASTLRELEFHLPLAAADFSSITRAAARHGIVVPALPRGRVEGYLKGFIDLVFVHEGRYCLADYKSNWLGDTAHDYAPSGLAEAMAREGYGLQALLYTVALHRWLKLRIPDYDYGRHFGGAFYLFLRGMAPEWRDAEGRAYGVHVVRPPLALVQEVDCMLSPVMAEAAR